MTPGPRQAVLGIDAAWTAREPSGVALIVKESGRWRLAKAAASYQAFVDDATRDSTVRHLGSKPDPRLIIRVAAEFAGMDVDVVAIDMPLSMKPIVGRRASDNMVSSLYGSRHAGTHTPSVIRPGKLSDDLRLGFEDIGYPLLTSGEASRALLEVYPHPALIELAAAPRRLAYKHSKARKYWPDDAPECRRQKLFGVWAQIVDLLDAKIEGVATALLMPTANCRGHEMKAFEDTLDAVVCAWVGACVLDGKATPYGDQDSAIWIPDPARNSPLPKHDEP